ncbi:hypothetical protein BK816_07715 [Boudabousia tangfeifanii]|uniref:Uncharacterized protein n=2 Tax=Boudabousia tangfeifanii TaxID=1912795 RepID=A0A1D9MLM6_9ACTO|nr:hypothetical protein BK816_07715 [Boudabousia tangfeifanii]
MGNYDIFDILTAIMFITYGIWAIAIFVLFIKANYSPFFALFPWVRLAFLCDIVFGSRLLIFCLFIPFYNLYFVALLTYKTALAFGGSARLGKIAILFPPLITILVAFHPKFKYVGFQEPYFGKADWSKPLLSRIFLFENKKYLKSVS